MVVEWKNEDFSSIAEKFSLHGWRSIVEERKILLWARHYIREKAEQSRSVCGGTDSVMLLEHEVFHMVNFAKNSKNPKGDVWHMSPCSQGHSWTVSAQIQAMGREADVVFEIHLLPQSGAREVRPCTCHPGQCRLLGLGAEVHQVLS